MTDRNAIGQLSLLLRTAFAETGHDAVTEALDGWPETASDTVRQPDATSLPVLSCLGETDRLAPASHKDLTTALKGVSPDLRWQQTYSESDFGAGFLERYGWTILVGPDAPVRNQTMLAGFLVLGSGIEYPTHKHAAEEIYMVVSGTASWKLDGADWTPLSAGTVVHNTPWREHAMRTDQGEPLLAAFLWRATAVEKSVIV